jgi:hypothetical protein
VRPEGLGKLKKFVHLIGSRIRDLPACSLVLQPLCYRVLLEGNIKNNTGCGKITTFLYEYINIKKEVSLPHLYILN